VFQRKRLPRGQPWQPCAIPHRLRPSGADGEQTARDQRTH
jgi:hypothetical protein